MSDEYEYELQHEYRIGDAVFYRMECAQEWNYGLIVAMNREEGLISLRIITDRHLVFRAGKAEQEGRLHPAVTEEGYKL